MLPRAWLRHLCPLKLHPPWSCIHRGPIYPSMCKQILSLKRRRQEAEPISQSQHQIVLPLPRPWASPLPSHQILFPCRTARCWVLLGQWPEHALSLRSPRSLRGRLEENCCCCCGWEGGRLSQAHMELQTCGSAKHRVFQLSPSATGACALTRQFIPTTPIILREFPLPRTLKRSFSHVPTSEQSRQPSRPPACSHLLYREDLGCQMALKHQRSQGNHRTVRMGMSMQAKPAGAGTNTWQELGFRSPPDTHSPQVIGQARSEEQGTDDQHAASAVPMLQAGTACTNRAALLTHSGCAHRPAAAHGQCKGHREGRRKTQEMVSFPSDSEGSITSGHVQQTG